jgi:hypothetical protein
MAKSCARTLTSGLQRGDGGGSGVVAQTARRGATIYRRARAPAYRRWFITFPGNCRRRLSGNTSARSGSTDVLRNQVRPTDPGASFGLAHSSTALTAAHDETFDRQVAAPEAADMDGSRVNFGATGRRERGC